MSSDEQRSIHNVYRYAFVDSLRGQRSRNQNMSKYMFLNNYSGFIPIAARILAVCGISVRMISSMRSGVLCMGTMPKSL